MGAIDDFTWLAHSDTPSTEIDHVGGTRGDFAPKLASGVAGDFWLVCQGFSRDTEVLMADGSSQAIADAGIGDRVVGTDPVTGVASLRVVCVSRR